MTTTLPITSLLPGESPRSRGLDQEHVAPSAGQEEALPPILARRSDLRVADGTHRLEAARGKGRAAVEVELFDVTAHESFLHAVGIDGRHGLALSPADRRAAGTRILASHPQLSDRAIAQVPGLGARTVATQRHRSTPEAHWNTRTGRDGRTRPLDPAVGRRRAADLITGDPNASLRTVARLAGIAPATAADVRKRLSAGQLATTGPVPVDTRPAPPHAAGRKADAPDRGTQLPVRTVPRPGGHHEPRTVPPNLRRTLMLEKLSHDPSLRLKEEGRHRLQLLRQNVGAREERRQGG
ncbi:transcriptional regulator [Kitasatospora sp. NPDC089913]|uniref:transcriptional regulator n=1 Tax=Kitasatospora sp. NPDC089913 TaxID=3364080 RepID=UPI0037FCFA23